MNSAHGSTVKKKKRAMHIFFWTDFERQLQLAFEQTSGDPSPLSVDVLLTTIDTR